MSVRRLCVAVAFCFAAIGAHAGAHQAPQAPALERLHDILRKTAEPHNAYISVAAIGNEETVPLLLERFRIDYGTAEPELPPGTVSAFICTHIHLVDALRSITNTDQGMYYPRWAAWWEANKHLSQHQWILDGFAAEGLHVIEPLDEQLALELIQVMGRGSAYRVLNAKRLLVSVRSELRAEWLVRASASEEKFRRLGAVAVLNQIDTTGHENLLRGLAADADLEIRREALTTMNERLRVSASHFTNGARRFPTEKKYKILSVSFAGNSLIAVFGNGRVRAFDAGSLRERWTHRVALGLGEQALVVGDQVVLAASTGRLLSLDAQGRVLWRKELDDENNEIRRLILSGHDVIVVRLNSLEQLDSKTGASRSVIAAAGFVRDADSDRTLAYFVDKRGVHAVGDAAGPEWEASHVLGISVTQRSVCVTVGGPDARVTI